MISLLSMLFKVSHNLIKEKLTELVEQTFNREGSIYLACNRKRVFSLLNYLKDIILLSCQKMCDALYLFLDNIFIDLAQNHIDKL